jgi:hypothetical protein
MTMGNVNKHRYSMSGIKVTETEKWGADKAVERYGSLKVPKEMNSPPHDCYPQFKQDQRLNKHYDAPNNWVRGAGESAEGRPGFRNSQGYNGGKRGR